MHNILPYLKGNWIRVTTPSFFDKAMNCLMVKTHNFKTLDEAEVYIADVEDVFIHYVYSCEQLDDGSVQLRSALGKTIGASLFGPHVKTALYMSDNYVPYKLAELTIDQMLCSDLEAMWGKDEVKRQLGEQLYQLLATVHVPEMKS